MLLPLDEPPDLLYRTITHELVHIFEFDIIPQSLIRRDVPLWINEGLSDFLAGHWAPMDLATVRDAAVADVVPRMSKLEGYGNFTNPRLIYNLGHAAYEFMESRWGKEGIRQFLFSLRKSAIGGGDSAYSEAFKMTAEEFDQAFEKYLKDRFKPFRDKERPADYGRNLAPNPEKSSFSSALTAEPSPSGDLLAVVTGNRSDREYDIVLVSARDGAVVRNLTKGFDKDLKFDYLSIPGTRWNTVPWLAWSPGGDRIAFVVRMGKGKGIVLQDVVTKEIVDRIRLTVDEPESPSISPNGRVMVFSALKEAKSDLWSFNLDTRELANVTNDAFYNYAPVFSPDGKFIVYLARVSGNEKLFRFDLETKKRTQLTFGTHDDAAARFLDDETIVFSSTALDPMQAVEPEVAKNGNIYNVWTLNLKSGELKQYTDSLGGNMLPVPLKDAKAQNRVAFITYYKGDYGLHSIDLNKPLKVAATSDFGAPGPIIDFQAPLSHTLVAQNKKKKGRFEKLFLDGRPPINVGVTNNGDIFGGTELSFSDVLGDHRFTFTAASISQYRTFAGSYMNLSRRFQYAIQGFSQKEFYYGASNAGYFYDPVYSAYIDRDLAQATRSMWGGSIFGIYPLDAYRRIEMSGGYVHLNESYNDPGVGQVAGDYQQEIYGRTLFNNGSLIPLSVSFVQETTIFREFGPLAGNTLRGTFEYAPKIGNSLERRTLDGDARYYLRLAGTGLLAMRIKGFRSAGAYPNYTYFGGNSEMRGYDYLEFIGQNAVFANAELRFPLIEAMLTPIGVMGGIRGVFYFNMGGGWFDNSGYVFWTDKTEQFRPLVGVVTDPITALPILGPDDQPIPIYGQPRSISGFRLRDARASYGLGLETFALGFPIHFDWSWRTLFNKDWENTLFATNSDLLNGTSFGGEAWRRSRFAVWIGYDF
jgi:Tol biopolymer transport system component